MSPFLLRLALLAWALPALLPGRAHAQGAQPAVPAMPEGAQQVLSFINRMVRIETPPRADGSTARGYGFIVGDRKGADGAEQFLIVTVDHLVRDPLQPGAKPAVPKVNFYANLALKVPVEVLDQRLPPAEGDMAVLAVPKPQHATLPPAGAADTGALIQGARAWEIGRPDSWDSTETVGLFARREPTGWLLFENLAAPRGSAGGAVLTAQGLAGMVVSEGASSQTPNRVVPVELLAGKMREWGLDWQITAPASATGSGVTTLAALTAPAKASSPLQLGQGGGSADNSAPRPAQAPLAQPGRPTIFSALPAEPPRIVQLLASEAAARASWVPPQARLSPWPESAAPLLATPRADAVRVGAIPPGYQLPKDLWMRGVYDILGKLDNGAWFLAGSEGKPLGYVSGGDVIEIWPPATGGPAGKIVREFTLPAGRAVLRDAGTYFDLTAPIACTLPFCNAVFVTTPKPPAEGGVVPVFQAPRIAGAWAQGVVAELHLMLPRRVVEAAGAKLLACIGTDDECPSQTLLGGK